MSILGIAGCVGILLGYLACFAAVVGGVAGVFLYIRRRLGFDDE